MRFVCGILAMIISCSLNGFSQTIVIGKFIDYETSLPVYGVIIYFDSLRSSVSDINGDFSLSVNEIRKNDTLKIRLISSFDYNFINLSNLNDTINLHNIPIFEYFPGHDMTDFFCKRFDFNCKRERKRHFEEERKRIEKYYSDKDSVIGKHFFIINHQKFRVNTINHCVDFNKPFLQ